MMNTTNALYLLFALGTVYLLGLIFLRFGPFSKNRKGVIRPLPPGPKGLPLVGNVYDLPPPGTQEWMHWLKHKDHYGPISSVTVMGQTLVIIHDPKIANELMDKRSAIYSSRPSMTFCMELCGWEYMLSNLTYSDRLRAFRKDIHASFGSRTAAARFDALQDVETRRFLLRVLEDPDSLIQHIRTEAGAVILKAAYGYTIEPRKPDPLVDLADAAIHEFAVAIVPGTWAVDIVPQLKYLPEWLPGTAFKRVAREYKKNAIAMVEKPYEFVKDQMEKGTHTPSYLSGLLEKGGLSEEADFRAKYTASSLYIGGSDTTVATLSFFFLAMTLYPDVQRAAQEELDRVVGSNRLPTISDRTNLPYIEAIIKETTRWHVIGPMGLPHQSMQDDIYEGYLIPKGAILLPNVWWFSHNPATYHEPEKFRPERFLGPQPEVDPLTYVFGFGRRACPGRHLADAALFLEIAQSLTVFSISKPIVNGKPVEPEGLVPPGIISHPSPYKANITPRSPEHEKLIRAVEVEHPWEESDAAKLESIAVSS